MAQEKKIAVKTQLAEKYERLANIAGSAAKKQRFTFRATRFRRQVEALKAR